MRPWGQGALTGKVKSTDQLIKMQCPAGKPGKSLGWVLF